MTLHQGIVRLLQQVAGMGPAFVDTFVEGPVDPARVLQRNSAGKLLIGSVTADELADRFGTPLQVTDEALLRANARAFRETFARAWPNTEVYYSYKTNSVRAVIEALHEEGFGAEIVSPYEGWLAEQLGVPGPRMVINGPGKSDAFIERAVRRGVRLYNIDSFAEIAQVARIAAAAGVKLPVGLRVAPPVGWSGQFGFAPERLLDAVKQVARCPSLELIGLHAHIGTNIRESDSHRRLAAFLGEQALRIFTETRTAISLLDIGGGYGVHGVRPIGPFDILRLFFSEGARVPRRMRTVALAETAAAVAEELERAFAGSGLPKPTLLLEPGRAVTSESQMLLARVLDVKRRPSGHTAVITDAGAMGYAMPLRWEWHELVNASRDTGEQQDYDVFGPLCTPSDSLGRSISLPRVEVGQVVALRDTGAYFAGFENNFAFPRSALVMVSGGAARLVRRHETFEDMAMRDEHAKHVAWSRSELTQAEAE